MERNGYLLISSKVWTIQKFGGDVPDCSQGFKSIDSWRLRLLEVTKKKTVSKSANRYATQTQWTCHLQHIITPVRLSEGVVWSRLMIFSTSVCVCWCWCCFRWRSWILEAAENENRAREFESVNKQLTTYLPTWKFETCLPTYFKRMTNGWPICRA